MITGRVVVGLPLNLFSVRWKYSCMALLAGISSFLRKYISYSIIISGTTAN